MLTTKRKSPPVVIGGTTDGLTRSHHADSLFWRGGESTLPGTLNVLVRGELLSHVLTLCASKARLGLGAKSIGIDEHCDALRHG